MRHLVLVVSICSVIACGKDTTTGDDTPADAPPLTGDKYSLTWGPVTVTPSQESTQCIWLRLGNDTEIKVHQLHDALSPSSHHLIVYRDDMDTTEQTTPIPCQPFTGALNTSGMIMPVAITQRKDDEITLPDGVAYTLAAHQMIKIEMHYINSSDADTMAQATVDFFAADPATIHDEASILFTGSPDIDIAPGATVSLHQFFAVPSYLDLSHTHIFAITGHTHQYGTAVSVNVAPNKTGPMTSVYSPNPFVWSEPETTNQATPFNIPVGGGLDFTCEWHNTGTNQIKFGESANDEMCFFWAYYYPSQGSKVCIHTDKYGGANGLNACCPGDSLCSLIGQMF
jgi:hypothetical protein